MINRLTYFNMKTKVGFEAYFFYFSFLTYALLCSKSTVLLPREKFTINKISKIH